MTRRRIEGEEARYGNARVGETRDTAREEGRRHDVAGRATRDPNTPK